MALWNGSEPPFVPIRIRNESIVFSFNVISKNLASQGIGNFHVPLGFISWIGALSVARTTHVLHEFLRARRPNEAVDVDVDEGRHQELAVEPVHDAAVTRDDVAEILNNEQ